MKKFNDITDNEIRIISGGESSKITRKKRFVRLWLPLAAVLLILGISAMIFMPKSENDIEEITERPAPVTKQPVKTQPAVEPEEVPSIVKGTVTATDTTINRRDLLILTPDNLRPRLVIGHDALNDSSIMLATQAADVRGDNGLITGSFVLNGELISKGEAKSGFCSIINDELTIGVADATPKFEQALTEGGYFFRQYPLVVGGQIVENKPKGQAIRKALAEIDGKICVIMSKSKLTFHDFSQLLTDCGVRNAIYLVGSSSYGFYVNEEGKRIFTSTVPDHTGENVNYIVWE